MAKYQAVLNFFYFYGEARAKITNQQIHSFGIQ